MRCALLLVVAAVGCVAAPEPIETTSESPAPLCGACLPPFEDLGGPGFSTWASPSCEGVYARGVVIMQNPPSSKQGRPCARFPMTGKVYCVDMFAPVPKVYYRDPADHVCKQWTTTSEDWYEWPEVAAPLPDVCIK